jgi:LDH2 family malate/lactate/ureidoglycolate dehydrogenase
VDASTETNTGHFIVALDIARFMPLDQFKLEVDRQLQSLRESARMPGFDLIRLPGADRLRRQKERQISGVIVPPPLIANLDALSRELGVPELGTLRDNG